MIDAYQKEFPNRKIVLRPIPIPGGQQEAYPKMYAMYAAGKPIEPVYPLGGSQGLAWIKDVIDRPANRTVNASRGDVTIELRS